MSWKRREWMLVGVLAVAGVVAPAHSQVALTTIADTVYSASGAPAQGTVVVSWNGFTTSAGQTVAGGTTSAMLDANGGLSVALAPNSGATPMGSYYTAIFHLSDGTQSRQNWVVPVSQTPVKLSGLQNQVLPTSVAMQTVSKAYVDHAIAAAVVGGGSGGGSGTAATVQKSGDTMTGPLLLPGDPVSPLQAADKHYVDASVAAVSGGAAQKVSLMPSASQAVVQPTGTQLEVNSLNGVLDATGFLNGNGNNGIGNALSAGCANGCELGVSANYPGGDGIPTGGTAPGTRLVDHRGGAHVESLQDPAPATGPDFAANQVTMTTTRGAQQAFLQKHATGANFQMLNLTHNAWTGGSNQFPTDVEQPPYNKANYGITTMVGNYNTPGQHVQNTNVVNCYSVGDCLAGGQFIKTSGGYRDQADEGTHPFDLQVTEDTDVYQGSCGSGCSSGSTSVKVNATSANGTQGDGRFLMDIAPGKVIKTGTITGSGGDLLPIVNFAGTNFPVSVQVVTAAAATSQANSLAPGKVTLPIATSGLPAAYATSTAALPATAGVACVTDQGVFPYFETAMYTVVDSTHIQLTLNKVHKPGAVIAVGGLCGYGLEQAVDTQGRIRQIFPVAGSPSPTQLYYAAANTFSPGVNAGASTGGFLNVSAGVANATRSGNVVTMNLSQSLSFDLNGLSVTVSGMSDPSFNGSFKVSTTGSSALTYTANGADGSSSGGTVSFNNGAYALYPMAEVLSVFNPATAGIDGTFTLAANTVPWTAGDPLEEPHYYQQLVYADTEMVTQFVPRPIQYTAAGKIYFGQLGPGARGWEVLNAVPNSNYLGAGGTHFVPDAAILTSGAWKNSVETDAGTEAALRVHCNLHGCNRWNSTYALLSLDSRLGQDFLLYYPQNNTAQWLLGGASFVFSPGGFSSPSVTTAALKAGANGNLQLAPAAGGYSNLTLNGNNSDTNRLGFVGGGGADPNLYFDVPATGKFMFRANSVSAFGTMGPGGLSIGAVSTAALGSGNSGNTDLVGTLSVPAGATTSNTQSFTGQYGAAPVCMVQPQNATPSAVQGLSGYVAQVSTSTLSVSVGTAPGSALVFGYTCVSRN